jgi:hypothetical protein
VGVTLHWSKVYANILTVWEKANFDIDVAQGKNLADASIEAGVQHLIWSSLPNVTSSTYCCGINTSHASRLTTRPAVTGGKVTEAKAFDSKAAIEEYIRELGIPATFYTSGVFMSNLKLATRKVRIQTLSRITSLSTSH